MPFYKLVSSKMKKCLKTSTEIGFLCETKSRSQNCNKNCNCKLLKNWDQNPYLALQNFVVESCVLYKFLTSYNVNMNLNGESDIRTRIHCSKKRCPNPNAETHYVYIGINERDKKKKSDPTHWKIFPSYVEIRSAK